jgi:hypothetical protein
MISRNLWGVIPQEIAFLCEVRVRKAACDVKEILRRFYEAVKNAVAGPPILW